MEPLGAYQPHLSRAAGVGLGVLAAVAATLLFELSRQLAEQHKGRWYAGNGRDVFHLGAAVVLAAALFLNGLPPSLSFALAGTAAAVPLAVLDQVATRQKRVLVMGAAIALAILPALLSPARVVQVGNAAALALLPRQ